MAGPRRNWAGNVTFGAADVATPRTVDELRRAVTRAPAVRVIGTGHSFNRIADTTGTLVSLAAMPAEIDVDRERGQVRVAAQVRYGELAGALHAAGLALHNLGSLPHICVAGACATGTHGSGSRNGVQATAVTALELVTADGDQVRLDEASAGDDWPGVVLALGTLGVVTHLELAVQPTYDVAQTVHEAMPREALHDHLRDVFAAGYSVSVFDDWRGPTVDQVWVKRRLDGPAALEPGWLGSRPAGADRHPVAGLPAQVCTPQRGVPGPWHERLPHFRLGFTPSTGDELQSEYFVDIADGAAALAAVGSLAGRIGPVLQVTELRTVAADELWLSPAEGRDTLAMHFTWQPDPLGVHRALAELEPLLAEFRARPHWAKVFRTPPARMSDLWPHLGQFRDLRRRFDPQRRFVNDFVANYLVGAPGSAPPGLA